MSKPVIAVDIDDVLLPFVSNIAQYHNLLYGTNVTVDDFLTYAYHDAWGGTLERAIQVVTGYHSQGYSAKILPFDGACAALDSLKGRFDFYVVTSRSTATADMTSTWVKRYFPGVFQEVLFGNHFALGDKPISKAELCARIHAGVLIDDNPGYVYDAISSGMQGVLFGNYPWNQAAITRDGMVRCSDWPAVRQWLEEYDG